ncbi:N-acetylglucosamine kinase [Streptomyces odontomachi]|uniref:N-acetylglucosamine kinase n=1 Tax=Streptomyces odontomachi TaxID=2944940 RepID=UPI00210B9159|nr:BadF/BadG/BcrA/BcrD ATPase family protein [Streptomyces sp. ODS25]
MVNEPSEPPEPPEPHEPPGAGALCLGIDAGGTRTRAVAADGRHLLGQGTGGPGNALSVPPQDLADHLTAALSQALPAGAAPRVRGVAAGVAGVSWLLPDDTGRGTLVKALRIALDRLGVPEDVPLDVRSDVEVAFASGPGTSADGLLALSGTGSAVVRFVAGRVVATVDGHGWLLDDAGSGHWIGRHAGRAALRALDGRGPWTALVPALTARFGTPVATRPADRLECERARARLLEPLITNGPVALARLCPLVVRAAEEGDEVAVALLDDAVAALAESVRAMHPVAGETLVTTGGLLGPAGPLLPRLTDRLAPLGLRPTPVADGTLGAIRYARRLAAPR